MRRLVFLVTVDVKLVEVEAGLAFVDDPDVSCRDLFAPEIDTVDAAMLLEGVDIGPFLAIDGGLQDGVDEAGELAIARDEDDTGEVAVVAKLDGCGGGGDIGVEVAAMFFNDSPVAGGCLLYTSPSPRDRG